MSKVQTKKSQTSEMIVGQAAQNLSKAVSELKLASDSLSKLSEKSEELSLLIANKEEQISALDVDYTEKARQAEVEFALNMKANVEKVVNEYLTSVGKTSILKSELAKIEKELSDTKTNSENEIKKAIVSTTSSLKEKFENDIKLMQSEHKAINAENSSKIGALSDKNNFLEDQVNKLYLQLDAERNAGIERAKSSSIGQVNIGDPNRK